MTAFSPALHYYVGGNSKVYGAALFRERDFGEVVHAGGISPAWPLGYDVFEPYYAEAERLFHRHECSIGALHRIEFGCPQARGAVHDSILSSAHVPRHATGTPSCICAARRFVT